MMWFCGVKYADFYKGSVNIPTISKSLEVVYTIRNEYLVSTLIWAIFTEAISSTAYLGQDISNEFVDVITMIASVFIE